MSARPVIALSRLQRKEIAAGRAEVLACANCGAEVYYGAMNLIALNIAKGKPSCSLECNQKLGQAR